MHDIDAIINTVT